METEAYVSFNYGAWDLVFRRSFDLPFTPFFGMTLITDDDKEYEVRLENTSYCTTMISYSLKKQQFEIHVRNHWPRPVTDETVDEVLEQFADWERIDSTDVSALKELMHRNHTK